MQNVTLALDERLVARGREYARAHGTSLNGLLRRMLEEKLAEPSPSASLAEFFRLADGCAASVPGYVFDRDEIYEHLYAD